MKNWVRRLNVLLTKLANTKWGTLALSLCALADASFLPLPVTTFFLILIVLNTRKAFSYVIFTVIGTVAGALIGYSIGHLAWLKPNGEYTGAVQFLFNNVPGFSEDIYQKVHVLYTKWDFWILCGATLTPLPYCMFSVMSGVFSVNILIFLVTTLISQGLKYSVLTIITLTFGSAGRKLFQLNRKPVVVISSVFILIILVIRIIL